VKGALEKLQTAIQNIQVYLVKRRDSLDPLASASASKSSISATEPTPAKPLSLSADILQKNKNIQLDLSGTSSARSSKMVEGGNWPSRRPLPKVVGRSEEVLQKSSMNQQNLAMKLNIRVPLKPKASTEASHVLSPQELQLAYEELLVTFSVPLISAA